MYKVTDLLTLHKYKQTFINYCRVFDIKLSSFYLDGPKSFVNNQHINPRLFEYFQSHMDFFQLFYHDWHKSKTIRQLYFETGIAPGKIIGMFNNGRIYANRILPIIEPNYGKANLGFNIDTEFRYYSRYQIIESIYKIQIIDRPAVA